MRGIFFLALIMGVLSSVTAQNKVQQEKKQQLQSFSLEQNNGFVEINDRSIQDKAMGLPFIENYEGDTFPPTDWAIFRGTNGAGTNQDWQHNNDGYEGKCAFVSWENTGTIMQDWMVSPQIHLGNDSKISYYEKQSYPYNWGSTYYLMISTNSQTNHADFTAVATYYEPDFSTSYSLRNIDLSAYDGQDVYIAFVKEDNNGDTWFVDNVLIEETPTGVPGGDLLITEIAEPKDDDNEGQFVEIYNAGNTNIDLSDYYLAFKQNSNKVQLSGTLAPLEKYVFAMDFSHFYNTYGITPDKWTDSNYQRINGKKAIYLLFDNGDGSFTRTDTYGVPGVGGAGADWDFVDKHAVRNTDVTTASSTFNQDEWIISTAYANAANGWMDVTPTNHNQYYIWTGAIDNNWDKPGNWSIPNGYSSIPDNGANVIISPASNNADGALYIFAYYMGSLNIQAGASFTSESHNILQIEGDINIESSGTLNLKSDATYTTAFIPRGNITGTINVERYFPSIGGTPTNGEWHYYSPPITNLESSEFIDQWLMYWDEPTTYWEYITATDEILNPGQGYGLLLKNGYGNLIDVEGDLFTGDVNTQNLNSTTGAGWQGWNLVGNPYTASIDWEEVVSGLPAGVEQSVHYWDQDNDQYVFYNNGSGSGSRYIPPMQGFFVHVTQDDVNFTIPASARVINNKDLFYKDDMPYREFHNNVIEDRVISNRIICAVTNEYGRTDKAYLEFNSKASQDFDQMFDASKFHSNNDTIAEMYLLHNSKEYSINVLPMEMLDGRYDLCIDYNLEGIFTLSFDDLASFNEDQVILLYDKLSDTYYDLRSQNNIQFNNLEEYESNRFEIVFDNYLKLPEEEKTSDFLVYAQNGYLNIIAQNQTAQIFEYDVYDLNGRIVYTQKTSESIRHKNLNLSKALYLVQIRQENSKTNTKVILGR